jgi:hypothetical protein
MPFVEPDGPRRRCPRADQHRAVRQCLDPGDEFSAYTVASVRGPHVGVANQRYIPHVLDSHYAEEPFVLLIALEHDPRIHLMPKIFPGHVWFAPAVAGDHAFIGLSGVIDDLEDRIKVVFRTEANHDSPVQLCRDVSENRPGIPKNESRAALVMLYVSSSRPMNRRTRKRAPSP